MASSRWIVVPGVAGLVLSLMLQLRAQQAPVPTTVIRIDVNLVQVDAVVTDAKGKPVTDLKVEDFELLQDGQPQKITGFDFINLAERRPTATPTISVQPRTRETDVPPPPSMPSLRADQIQRTMAIVVDDLALSFDSAVRVRETLKKWVDTEMRTGDLVAIVRTRSGMGSMQRFSMDRQTLRAAIDQIRYGPGRVGTSSVAPLRGAMPTDGVLDTSLFDDEVAHAYLTGSLVAIRDVIRGLRDLPGRKSLILFTEDMRFTYLEGTAVPTRSLVTRTGETYMRRLADEANRSSVVIHAVDPRGVFFTGLTAEDNGNVTLETLVAEPVTDAEAQAQAEQAQTQGNTAPGPPVPATADRVNQRYDQLIASRDGMVELTRRTGGLFAASTNDIGAALRQVVDDGDGYYLLGYQPDLTTFDINKQTAFHSLRVRVKRPGLTVRSRSGFFGSPDTRSVPEPEARRNQLTKALTSPFESGDVRVRLTGLVYPGLKEAASITVMLHFDTRDVAFTESPEGLRAAEVDIVAVTFDAEGEPVDTMARTAKLAVPKEFYPELLKSGFVYALELPIKKPGAYQLRAVLRDAGTQRIGSAMQFINVPDFNNGRLTLSGIVLTEDSGAQKAGEPEQSPRAGQAGSPALRVFKPGAALVYAYQVLNPRTDADKKTQLDSRIRLFRNGEQVYEGNTQNVEQRNVALDPKRLGVAGRIQLLKLQPGSYVLQIIVQDNNRYDKYRIATQAIDFEVQETSLEAVPVQSR
jgi:VWFA-related protein